MASMQGGANSIANGRDNRGEEAAPVFPPNGDALPTDPPGPVLWAARPLFVGDEEGWRLALAGDPVEVVAERVVVDLDSARCFRGAKPIRWLSRSNTA